MHTSCSEPWYYTEANTILILFSSELGQAKNFLSSFWSPLEFFRYFTIMYYSGWSQIMSASGPHFF